MNKTKLLFVVFSLAVLFPPGVLESQEETAWEDYNDDDYYDDYPPLEGEGLTIVGSKNTTQQMDIIDRETIEKTHAADLPSLLEETLGLGVIRYGPYGNQAGVNLRGFDVKRIAILVDGVPVNSAASGNFDFYSVDPLSVERIEVIHGGSDTKFNVSGALGGVINIVTVKKPKPGWKLGGNISNTSYLPNQAQDLEDAQNVNLYGAYGTERYSFNLNLSGNRAGNHFLYKDYYGFSRRKEGNEIFDGGVTASYTRNIGDYATLIAAGSFYYGNKNIPVSGYTSVFTEQEDMMSRESIMLDMPRAWHDDVAMEFALSHNWKETQFGPSFLSNENNLTAINRWSWYPGTKFTLRFGGDYRFIHLDSTDTGLHYENRGGLYVTSEYSPIKKLLFIASVKGMTDGREIIPVPKLGWSWAISDNITLKNNYFRSFKFPDFDDLYWVQGDFMGNPDLKSEDGWGADLGTELSIKDWFKFDSAFYGQWTDNSIHWNNSSGKWRPENFGTAAFFGIDNRLEFILPFSPGFLEKPVLGLSWLFQLSWLLNGDLTFGDDKRIPYMPVHTLGVSLELPWITSKNKLPGLFLVSGQYQTSRYADTKNITELSPYFLLNIIYNQKLNKNFDIFGKINNVLNTRYFSYADYPMPGISMTLGLRAGFSPKSRQN